MKYLFIFIFFLLNTKAKGQIQSIDVSASGLTCSMCSKAIFKALSQLDFVSAVKVDLEKSIYTLTFKSPERVKIEEIRDAVYDAGFSIETMQMTANFPVNKAINNEVVLLLGYQFKWELSSEKSIKHPQKVNFLNKDLLPVNGVYSLNF
jgi:copper chaperone CopZ